MCRSVTRLALLTALTIAFGVGSHAQPFRERLQQGVSKAQQGATAVRREPPTWLTRPMRT